MFESSIIYRLDKCIILFPARKYFGKRCFLSLLILVVGRALSSNNEGLRFFGAFLVERTFLLTEVVYEK